MGQLRTANKRRNRAIRQSVARLRAATAENLATTAVASVAVQTKPAS